MDFASTLNSYTKEKKPCFFIISFDKKAWHVESLNKKNSDFLYRFKLPKHKKHLHVKLKIKKLVSKKRYKKAFLHVRKNLKNGNTYLLNLTFASKIKFNVSLKNIYKYANAPYCCYKKDEFVCFSPEMFVSIKNNLINTYPMKGTINANIKNAKQKILNNKKEMAEHAMIVDLMRNDLSMVSENVRVKKLRFVQKIQAGDKKLLQVSSHIQGKLKSNWYENVGDILDTLLQAGSISGTPKQNTIKIIKEAEKYKRGYYTGVFGVFDGLSLKSAVMIRFIQKNNNSYIYKSGGGITIDSKFKDEYKELKDKIYVPVF